MTVQLASIHSAVAGYYSRSLALHGPTPSGVDWSSGEGQELRFEILTGELELSAGRTLLDYGCGYGALAAYLDGLGFRGGYVGYDIAPSMLAVACEALEPRANLRFTSDPAELEPVDYVVASGVFNVKLEMPVATWRRYVEVTLEAMASLARRSMAFNMLPPASSPEHARPDLYYADPAEIVRFCEENLGCTVSLRQDYGLWEYTVHAAQRDAT